MKNLKVLYLLLIIVLVSCGKSTDSIDFEPILEEAELSPDAFVAFYNSAIGMPNISLKINSSEEKVELTKTLLSKYFLLGKGQHEIVIINTESGEELLTKTVVLDPGYYYSSHIYINHENKLDLLLSKDYDESFRSNGSLTSALELVAVNLSSNIPFESLDIINSLTYVTANCGAGAVHCTIKCNDLKDQWVDDLAFGTSQRIPHASLSITSNYLQFLSSSPDAKELKVEGFISSPKTIATDPNGSGNILNIERLNNIFTKLDNEVLYLLIVEDELENEGIRARFVKLSTNPISDLSFQ